MARSLLDQVFQSPTLQKPPAEDLVPRTPDYEDSHSPELLKKMALELSRLRKHVQELETKMQNQEQRYNELVTGQKKVLDKVHGALQMFDERIKSVCQDLVSRFSQLRGRMTEQKGYETKVEGLIERHNSLVQNFEMRLDQVQKVVKEQEMQLHNFKSMMPSSSLPGRRY